MIEGDGLRSSGSAVASFPPQRFSEDEINEWLLISAKVTLCIIVMGGYVAACYFTGAYGASFLSAGRTLLGAFTILGTVSCGLAFFASPFLAHFTLFSTNSKDPLCEQVTHCGAYALGSIVLPPVIYGGFIVVGLCVVAR